jgi:hypothetical protein
VLCGAFAVDARRLACKHQSIMCRQEKEGGEAVSGLASSLMQEFSAVQEQQDSMRQRARQLQTLVQDPCIVSATLSAPAALQNGVADGSDHRPQTGPEQLARLPCTVSDGAVELAGCSKVHMTSSVDLEPASSMARSAVKVDHVGQAAHEPASNLALSAQQQAPAPGNIDRGVLSEGGAFAKSAIDLPGKAASQTSDEDEGVAARPRDRGVSVAPRDSSDGSADDTAQATESHDDDSDELPLVHGSHFSVTEVRADACAELGSVQLLSSHAVASMHP